MGRRGGGRGGGWGEGGKEKGGGDEQGKRKGPERDRTIHFKFPGVNHRRSLSLHQRVGLVYPGSYEAPMRKENSHALVRKIVILLYLLACCKC